jgi:hypothetical protein
MFRKLKAGETSQSIPIFILDTTSAVGAGLGSLVYNTSSLAAKYRRQGQSSWTAITLATMTAGTWASGGFVADGGPVTGGYEFGIPDAVLASSAGVEWAEIMIYGAANMLPVKIFVELDAINYQDSVRAGLTALPNAAAGANGGLPLGDAAGRVTIGAVAAGAIAAAAFAANALDAVWSTATRLLTAGTNIVLAKGTGVTGFNDPTAAAIRSEIDANSSKLDAAVSTRLATAGYSAPPTVVQIRQELDANSADLDAIQTNQTTINNNVLGIPAAVWLVGTRTLTGFGTLVADIASAVWGTASRTLSAFGFTVNTNPNATETAIKTNTDKIGTAMELDGGVYRFTANALEQAPAGGGGGGGSSAADIWSYPDRSLTQTASQVQAVLTGSRLVIHRGDSWSQPLTAAGALTGYAKLWLTIKRSKNDADEDAVLQWLLSSPGGGGDGLQRLNGAAAIAADGALTVQDEALGNLTPALTPAASLQLAEAQGLYYDIQILTPAGVVTRAEGRADVTLDVTRATS